MALAPNAAKDADGGIAEDVRKEANELVFRAAIAAQEGRVEDLLVYAAAVEGLGLTDLADKMRRRFVNAAKNAEITITVVDGGYRVETPFRRGAKAAFIEAWRSVPGRRWKNGANWIPMGSRKELWAVLQQFFGGRYGKGPKGVFRIPDPVDVPVAAAPAVVPAPVQAQAVQGEMKLA